MLEQLQFGSDGQIRTKVETGIQMLRAFEPPEGYFLANSGGKDSQAVRKLAKLAGVKHDDHYNVTGLDAPETVRFLISQYDTVVYMINDKPDRMYTTHGKRLLTRADHEEGDVIYFHLPKKSMWELIPERKMPPTRKVRYCCEELKETNGAGRFTLTGVRRGESSNRKINQGLITIPTAGKKVKKELDNLGVNFTKTKRGGVVLNYDDDPDRRITEYCIRTGKALINPLADWTEEDVWEFIRDEPHCCLYDEGFSRCGCLGCPMGGYKNRMKEMERWPYIRKLYLKSFEKLLKARKTEGLPCENWETPEDVMRWWLEDR